jgi:hypothetical protein
MPTGKLKAQTFTNLYNEARAGLASRMTPSTAPSPPLTAGPRTFRPRRPSPACSRSTSKERINSPKVTPEVEGFRLKAGNNSIVLGHLARQWLRQTTIEGRARMQ